MTRFAIAIPQFYADAAFEPASFKAYMSRAEGLGFDSAWTQEQILGSMPMLGPMETMTFAAACTERMRLGCVVFVSALHSPLHLAKSVSTLDQLSRGRLDIGVAAGGRFRPFAAFGVDPTTFVSRFTEGLRLMKALWTEPNVTFRGRFWQLDKADMEPKPLQKPYPPIWFGASHPKALRRAVEYGDGFFGAGSTTTAQFARQVPVVREVLEEASRDPSTFRIAKRVYIAVDSDPERARNRVVGGLQRVYAGFNLPQLENVAVYGRPDDCARGIREVVDAGAELVLFTPFFDEDGKQMEQLASEVIPQLA
ncbi:MAG: LLM class flavin-dependent oxidoreductase [Chloroflexi bacterium]|nr:LLM class flavin-dependent oxidoreductase [Chloroflexota bacterium]